MFDSNEELRNAVRSVVEAEMTGERRRAIIRSDDGFDASLWEMFAELGWPAIHIPERHGGLGGSFAELCIIVEELGRGLAPSPFFTSTALASTALLESGNEAMCRWLLPDLASGSKRAAFAHGGGSGRRHDFGFRCRKSNAGYIVEGQADFVLDAHLADRIVLAAIDEDGAQVLLAVESGHPGLTVTPVPGVDLTRRLAAVTAKELALGEEDCVAGAADGADVLRRTLALASIAIAADSLGGAARVLQMTVDYARTRTQFGRAIGSFQAVKHKCADMLLLVEGARAVVHHAAEQAAARNGPIDELASIAKSYATDAYAQVAASGLQLHGGSGFTWDHDMHLHLKRAQLGRQFFGLPDWHLDNIAATLIARSRQRPGDAAAS